MLKRLRFVGGEIVKAGFYWNLREWEAQVVPREGGPLKGGPDERYLRVPLPLLLLLAPLMGAAYAMFLPFIGFAMLTAFLVGRLKTRLRTTPSAEAPGGRRAA